MAIDIVARGMIESTSEQLNERIDDVEKNKSYVFNDYESMVNDFNSASKSKYKLGNNIFIKTKNVPDLWISGIGETTVEYVYTSDEAIVSALKNGNFQVGWYQFSILETQESWDFKMDKENPTGTGKLQINGEAEGIKSVAIGDKTTAYGDNSVAEGTSDHLASDYFTDTQINTVVTSAEKNSKSSTDNQNIQNFIDTWDHQDSQGDGDQKFALSAGRFSHTEGANSVALSKGGHAEGNGTFAGGKSSHSEGTGSKALGNYSHAGGLESETGTVGAASFAHGWRVKANGNFQTVFGIKNLLDNTKAFIIGNGTDPDGGTPTESNAFTVDWNGNGEFAGEVRGSDVKGSGSIAIGVDLTVGTNAQAFGNGSKATGTRSHAEGYKTTASGSASHSEGRDNTSIGDMSHTEGRGNSAEGAYSHAEGRGTNAKSESSHVQGKYNIKDTSGIYAHIVGNGTSDTARSNAHTLDWTGNAWYAGDVTGHKDGATHNLSDKVDKVQGKGLSTNDFTNNDKTKLDGIEAGAEVNDVTSVAGKTGVVTLDKNDVGLSNVDNTSDANKPISTATQTALDGKASTGSVSSIEAKIPNQASAQNQLADKEFVNSSVATNTANYISNNGEPFTSKEQLEAYSGTVTNNDYAFVTGTDSSGNTYYDRYKATVSGSTVSWAKEFRLNNSSFTSDQWSAINSGITDTLVGKLNNIDLSQYYTKTEIDTSIASKQNVLVSGQNIKTVKGESILGSGDLNPTRQVEIDIMLAGVTEQDGDILRGDIVSKVKVVDDSLPTINRANITSISLPNAKTIGETAFYGSGATTIKTPNVTEIGKGAFANNHNLVSIKIPNVTKIESQAFYYNNNLVSIEGFKVTEIGAGAFQYSGLTEVIFPKLKIIEGNCFVRSASLETAVFQDLTNIKEYAFTESSLNSLILFGDSAVALSDTNAFDGTVFEVGKTTGDYGLVYYKADPSLSLYYAEDPNWSSLHCSFNTYEEAGNILYVVTNGTLYLAAKSNTDGKMSDYAYNNPAPWQNLDFSRVVILNGVTKIGSNAFYQCSNLTDIIIPDTVIEIGQFALSETGLITVNIPDSVTSLGIYLAYNSVNLKTVIVGNGVSSLSNYAFFNCKSFDTLVLKKEDSFVTTSLTAFSGTSEENKTKFATTGGTAYVPQVLIEAYQTDSVWGDLTCNFVAIEGTEYDDKD